MTTYTFKIQQPGDTLLSTPRNLHGSELTRSGVGIPFNVELLPTEIPPSSTDLYILTQIFEVITTEDALPLEVE